MKPQAKNMVLEFGGYFRDTVGEIYPPTWGRDMKIMSALIDTYGTERVQKLLKLYFQTPSKIYSIPFFKVAIAELIQKEVRTKPSMVMPESDNWRFA